jgi:hypothetical protein
MNCSEFQKVLPFIIETGGSNDEEEHLKTCAVCSDLVQDLRYIADAAKLLLATPMEDPGPKVWDGIQKSLEQEGIVRPTGPRGRLLSFKATFNWIFALGAATLAMYAGQRL